ncbi:response regulator transcription factor [Anaerococcus sp. mt242]|uniref:response regulator transcription factor n=1 Tax=Anaerococcus sp. mt242 TaxID=2661917 RepID=UPI001932CDD1|nr:response regulator transcription factor [Anaerococcus sp. mt242]MBM0046513.1 response regulator transcription factor [Anaerococcus sp. mt242]
MNSYDNVCLLIVDDEIDLLGSMYKFLVKNNFKNVLTAKNIKEAKFKLENNKVDLLVLDIMLPDGSGFDLLSEVRKTSKLPVIVLSALDGRDDMKSGFDLEADDYIIKPLLPEDLLWRIRAVLRRSYKQYNKDKINLNGVIFDKERALLIKKTTEIPLTAKQFKILDYMSENLNKIVSIDQIIDHCWEDSFGYENTLITHIYRLREKLEDDPSNPKILVTIKGLGYKLKGQL